MKLTVLLPSLPCLLASCLCSQGLDSAGRGVHVAARQEVSAPEGEASRAAFEAEGEQPREEPDEQSADARPPAWRPDPGAPGIVPRLVAQTGHADDLTVVALSPDGQLVATGAKKGPVILWQAATGRELMRLEGPTAAVRGLVFARDGARLFAAGDGGALYVWSLSVGRLESRYPIHLEQWQGQGGLELHALHLSPDGSRLLLHYELEDSVVMDIATESVVTRFAAGNSRQLAFDASGDVLGLSFEDGGAVLSNLSRDTEVRRFPRAGKVEVFDEGRKLLMVGSDVTDWDLRCVAVDTGDVLWSLPSTGTSGPPSFALFSAAANTLLSFGDGYVLAMDARTLADKWLQGVESSDPLYPAKALGGGFNDGGSVVATIHKDRGTRVWNVATGKLLATLEGGCDVVSSLALSDDGALLLVGQGEEAVLWSSDTGAELRRTPIGERLEWAATLDADGRRMLTVGGGAPRLWGTASGEVLQRFSASSGLDVAALSPDSRVAALAGRGEVDFHDLVNDALLGRHVPEEGAPQREVRDVAFAPDGATLALGGAYVGLTPDSRRGWAALVEVPSGAVLQSFDMAHAVNAVAFSPDGSRVLTGSYNPNADMWPTGSPGPNHDGGTVWDTRTGRKLAGLQMRDDVDVAAVAFSPDGSRALLGLSDHTARVWDANGAGQLLQLAGHDGPVTAVAFSPDGARIFTASDDHTIRVWNMRGGAELGRMVSFSDGSWAVVDRLGRFDASNDGDVEGLHWVVGHETIALQQLKERYYEPGLLAKLLGRNEEPLRDVRALAEGGIRLPPRVEVLQQPTAEDPTLRFALTDRGGGIGRVAVRVNRKEVSSDARSERDPNVGRLEVSLSLAGHPAFVPGASNTIEIVPFNAEAFLSARGSTLHVSPGGGATGELPALYAVVAGVSDYQGTDLDLKFASRDAQVMGDALELAGLRLFGDPARVHVTRLIDGGRPATRAALMQALDGLQDARWFDVVVVYLAGHGVTHGGVDGDYYYLTQDARSGDLSDPGIRRTRAFSSVELKDRLAALAARKQVLILDTCFAGQLIVDLTTKRDVPASQKRALVRLKDQTGTFLLAGSASDSVSYEASPFGHGLLTYSLLRAMKDALRPAVDAEGRVDVMGLFSSSQDQVPLLASDLGGVQRPQVAMPKIGESFAIGQLGPEERAAIPLERPLPALVSAGFELADQPLDPLGLTARVRVALGERTVIGTRAASFFLVEETPSDDAWRVAGRYERSDGQVVLTAYLYRGTTLVDSWEQSASEDALGPLVDALIAWAEPLVR